MDSNIEKKEKYERGGEGFNWEKEKPPSVPEKKHNFEDEKIISEELKREIGMMEAEGNSDEAKKKAEKIRFLGEEQKLERLMQIARDKGVAQAVQTAKSMNDAHILDTLHDTLAKEGYYKNFLK